MRRNVLLTGEPGVGKTTVVRDVVERVERNGGVVRGVVAPEIRSEGERVGFRLVDVGTGEGEVMAHVDYEGSVSVGRYGVDRDAVDAVSRDAIEAEGADLVVVDEIAPMETCSDVFVARVRDALDADTPVVGVVKRAADEGFVDGVKRRGDVGVIEVTRRNRDDLPASLVDRLG